MDILQDCVGFFQWVYPISKSVNQKSLITKETMKDTILILQSSLHLLIAYFTMGWYQVCKIKRHDKTQPCNKPLKAIHNLISKHS